MCVHWCNEYSDASCVFACVAVHGGMHVCCLIGMRVLALVLGDSRNSFILPAVPHVPHHLAVCDSS